MENAVLVEFVDAYTGPPTAEDLARHRYGRPDPRRYLPEDERPPTDPPATK